MKKIFLSVLAMLLCASLLFSCNVSPESKYESALEMIENGDHTDAYKTLLEIEDYADSKELLEKFLVVYEKIIYIQHDEEYAYDECVYDDKGNLLKLTKHIYDESYTYEYTYDDNGNAIKTKTTTPSDITTEEATYDESGKIIKLMTTVENIETPGDVTIITTDYVYDDNDRLITGIVQGGDAPQTIDYTCDDNGNVIKSVTTQNGEIISVVESSYDQNGRVVSSKTEYSSIKYGFSSSFTIEYDSKGNKIKEEINFASSRKQTTEFKYEKVRAFYLG